MVSDLSSTPEMQDILRQCQIKAQQLKELIGTLAIPVTVSSSYSGPIPDLDLLFPNDILLSIDDMALPEHLCQQMKSKLTERIVQSQQACIEAYQQTCRQLPGHLTSAHLTNLANTFRNYYTNHQIPKFRAKILNSQATLDMFKKNRPRENKRPAFNNEYTPMLENYFENNAYPSRPDRVLLARKSCMTERQIEVWFQNHRNRSKKEGIPLKRLSPQQSLPANLSARNHNIPDKTLSPSRIDMHMPDDHPETSEVVTISPLLPEPFSNPVQSPWVFPNSYHPNPQNAFSNPLPPQEGTARFTPPNWQRKPARQPPSRSSINMEDFINMFASKLSIRRGLGSKTTYGSSGTRAWYLSTVTVPSPAPHPALIRTTVPNYPSSPTPFSSAIHSIPMIISNVSSISRPSTPSRSKRFSRPRKAAPFPFRYPQKPLRMRLAKTLLPAFERYSSRTISFTSVSSASSTQSRTSSDSSRSSPGLTTPPQSPSNNPVEIHDPFVLEVHESAPSDSYDDIFAGIANPHFSDIQNLDDFLNNGAMYTDKYFQDSLNFQFPDPQYATA
uniref:Homeodomain protein n=1 Tax=Pholiota microspora TaxID=1538424 RepID=B9A1S0_PHOMI|nr:homeodomain protein [Pholiota nameko]